MKILLVEDGEQKARRITDYVAQCDGAAALVHCTNANDAFREISKGDCDLLLLDVRLPLTSGSDPSEEGSIWLLREIIRKLSKKSIPMVVGTTQYEESLHRVQDTFKEFLWSIILVTENEVRWRSQLALAINLVRSKASSFRLPSPDRQVDVAILVALRFPEYERLMEAIGGGELFVLEETNEHWMRSRVRALDGREVDIICACADEMGMCSMASLTTRLSVALRPRKIILTGIMAGNSDHVALGDLIAIDETWDYRAGKITETGFEPDVRSQRCSQKLLNGLRAGVPDAALRMAWEKWPGEKPRAYPQLHVGPVACSPAVVKDERVFLEIQSQKRKTLGLEMEAYGCFDAARRLSGAGPEVLCLKSVCDLGDKLKSDKYQAYCAYLAASITIGLASSPAFLDC